MRLNQPRWSDWRLYEDPALGRRPARGRGRRCQIKAPHFSKTPRGPRGKRTRSRTFPYMSGQGVGGRGEDGPTCSASVFSRKRLGWLPLLGPPQGKGLQLSRKHSHGRKEARWQRRPRAAVLRRLPRVDEWLLSPEGTPLWAPRFRPSSARA